MISVIIPCFNAEPWIREALGSVNKQGISNIEIIVVDDGSTDRSAQIIEKEFPYVTVLRISHGGPSKARNVATKVSKGEFLQYLDADDILAPGKLTMQLDLLRRSNADIAYGKWQRFTCNANGEVVKGVVVDNKILDPEIDLFVSEVWAPPAVFLFRRSLVEKIAGWNEDLALAEDARFLFDCTHQHAQFVYCEAIMAYYRVHDSLSRSDPVKFVQCCMKNICDGERYWRSHGGIDERKKKALIKSYGYLARAAYEFDRAVFTQACEALQTLSPGYIPASPVALRMLSRLIGYSNAEAVALRFRAVKKIITTR